MLALTGLFALAAPPAGARAQVVNFQHYTAIEGLPQAQVLAIHQDRAGYLWFASYGGLSRFNGSEFVTWTKEDGLSSNSVFDIVEDKEGRLVMATSAGACRMEQVRFECWGQADGLVYDNARTVAVDALNGIWVGTARGLSYVLNGRVRNYTRAEGLPGERVVGVAVDSAGRVWAATDRGLARLWADRFEADPADEIGQAPIQFIAPTSRGLLVGTRGRLYLRQADVVIPVAAGQIPAGTTLTDAAVDRDGTIWVGTRTGALRIRDGHVTRLDRSRGLLSDLINRVTVDAEGGVWFGTESGASKHVPGPFSTYTMEEGLPSSFVRALALDERNRLWAGTRDGVAVREGDRFRALNLGLPPDSRVFSLAHNPGGGMLIGTRRGLVWWQRDGRSRAYYRADGLPGEVIYSMVADGPDVWLGTDHGLARWRDGRITRFGNDEIARMTVMALGLDAQRRLWLGGNTGGLSILDADSLIHIGPEQGGTDQTIWAITRDAQNRMWVATNGDGVLRFDEAGIRRFTMRDGLASNFVWQVLADSRGDIWIYGNSGLDRFSGDDITHYGRGAGLIELEGSANAAHEDGEGNIWFGTGSGLVRYVPGLDVAPAVTPPIYIEALTHNDQPVDWQAGTSVRLPDGVVRIKFASPSFRDESAVRYQYRLVGRSARSWSEPTSDRTLTFAGLAPGHYRFEVKAMNRDFESAAPATVSFTILPAFWQTWWFRIGGVLVLAALLAVAPALRAWRLEQERRRLEALVAQHTRELADKNEKLEQSNRDLEHFAYVASHDLQEPLRKIQAFSDRVSTRYTDKLDEQGRDYLARMGSAAARMQRLIDDLLSLSRITTRRNEPQPIDLNALAEEVLGDLEIRIQSTHGRVEIGALPTIVGDPVQIRQVLQNLIGNALKFHRKDVPPVVTVSGRLRDPLTAEIRVRDNGVGFESRDAERVFLPFQRLHSRAEYEGTGIGLTICQKIVQRHGGMIRASSVPGEGTEFIITLPIQGPAGEEHAA